MFDIVLQSPLHVLEVSHPLRHSEIRQQTLLSSPAYVFLVKWLDLAQTQQVVLILALEL